MFTQVQEESLPISFKQRLFLLLQQWAVEKKDVILACGEKSSIYIDCRQVYFRGEALYLLGELFYEEMVKHEALGAFSACGGMALGCVPLSCALSLAAFRRGRDLPGFAVRKETKNHGMQLAIEGNKCLSSAGRTLIVEDVVTSASSAIQAIKELRAQKIVVDTVLAIVDREQGGKENLAAMGVKLSSLFVLKDLE